MFVLKEHFVFGIILHHPPFDLAQKDGRNLGNASRTNHCESLNIMMFDKEHK
jgi:hypothetical protein